jgi:hypothetical protein
MFHERSLNTDRWHQNAPQGGSSSQLSFSGANNRMDGYSYDLSGNLQTDGTNWFTYDAEGRISQVNVSNANGALVATYVYNADGQRVRKTVSGTTTDYIYDLAGHEITEVNGSGGWNRSEVYAGGHHLATYTNSTTYFIHADWLGTERVRSTLAASSCETTVSLPFGDGQSSTGPCTDVSPLHFPYADLGNPQTLNLYLYVKNNPLSLTDPDGHFWKQFWNYVKYECYCDQQQLNQFINDRRQWLQQNVLRIDGYKNSDFAKLSPAQVIGEYNRAQAALENDEFKVVTGTPPNIVPGGGIPVPIRDITGRVHADLPDHVPDNWTKEDLEQARDELKESIKRRNEEQVQMGEEGGHRERIRREEQLLRQIEKKLRGS